MKYILLFLLVSLGAQATTFSVKRAPGNQQKMAISPTWTGEKIKYAPLMDSAISYNTGVNKLRAVICEINNECFRADLVPADIHRLSLGVELLVQGDCTISSKETSYSIGGTHYSKKETKAIKLPRCPAT